MGKPTICIGKNKDADQLRGNREAGQRLCSMGFNGDTRQHPLVDINVEENRLYIGEA